jgi:RNA polymerase sigma factor for flagellar operon FliA
VTLKTEETPAGLPQTCPEPGRRSGVSLDFHEAESKPNCRMQLEDSPEHLKAVAARTYSGQKSPAIPPQVDQLLNDEQIARFLPMVHKIAHRTVTYIKPPLSFEDLVSAGTVGLVRAARDFDSSHQAEFKTYAYIRIKGAILDELRSSSSLPVNVNKQIRNARQLCQKITEQTGTAPTDDELAEKLGITVDELYELFENDRVQHFISIDSLTEEHSVLGGFLAVHQGRDIAAPERQLEQAELIDKLTEAIQQLDPRRRQIILLYYQQHLTMKQIADLLKVTESRVSQLHASALFSLSVKLRQWKDGR